MNRHYVVAWIGSERVAFDATGIEAVVDIAMVVPVPKAAAHVIGLAAIRSQVLTVIDCSIVVGERGCAPTGRAIVASVEGHRYALRIDRVEDVVSISSHGPAAYQRLGPVWRNYASQVIEIDGGFAVVVDPASIVTVGSAAIAA